MFPLVEYYLTFDEHDIRNYKAPPRNTPKVMYRLYVLVNGQIIFKSTNVNKLLENYEYVVPF